MRTYTDHMTLTYYKEALAYYKKAILQDVRIARDLEAVGKYETAAKCRKHTQEMRRWIARLEPQIAELEPPQLKLVR